MPLALSEFWKPYDLTFAFSIKHKAEHTCLRAAYFGKADYAVMETTKKGKIFSHFVRGKPKKTREGEKENQKVTLLRTIIDNKDFFPADMTYTKRGVLLKIGMFNIVQASQGFSSEMKKLRPGDNTPSTTQTDRFNNNHFPILALDEYTRRRDRGGKKYVRGKWQQLFEKYGDEGISGVLSKMAADDLRN